MKKDSAERIADALEYIVAAIKRAELGALRERKRQVRARALDRKRLAKFRQRERARRKKRVERERLQRKKDQARCEKLRAAGKPCRRRRHLWLRRRRY